MPPLVPRASVPDAKDQLSLDLALTGDLRFRFRRVDVVVLEEILDSPERRLFLLCLWLAS